MDEILADYNEAELELLAGFLQKVTAAGVIAAALSDRGQHPPIGQHARPRSTLRRSRLADARPRFVIICGAGRWLRDLLPSGIVFFMDLP